MTRAYLKSPDLEAKRFAIASEMAALHKSGMSIGEVAKKYGVRKTAIIQRLERSGLRIYPIADRSGGAGLAVAMRVAARIAALDARSLAKWGCTHEQYLMLRRMRKPTRAYQCHERNARHRGIGWEFNLWQWWAVWQESGHWPHRGAGQGYVMCRYGDVGPYAAGNIFIAPGIINCSDKAAKLSGLPIGVSVVRNRFRATRMIDGKRYRLGTYKTPEVAHDAYLSLGPIGVAS